MGLIGQILLTIICLLLSFYCFRLGQKTKEDEPGIDAYEIAKRHNNKVGCNIGCFLFLLPLVSCWFPKWANAHNWNLSYIGILFVIFLFYGLPRIREEKDNEDMKKSNNNDYESVD